MIQLADISEIRAGYTMRNAVDTYGAGEVEVIQAKDLSAGLQSKDRPRIDFPGATKHLLKPGDILVSARGSLRAAVYTATDGLAIASSSLFIIRLASPLFTAGYIAMFINSDAGREALARRSSGGSILTITKEDLGQVAVPQLTVDGQRKLSQLVDAIDQYQDALTRKQEMIEVLRAGIINNTIKEAAS